MQKKRLTYSSVGDDYSTKDPIKILAQKSAIQTSKHLQKYNFSEVSQTRGESAFVWKQVSIFMASVIEGLGTKNLVADEMYLKTGKTYYDVIGHDTVATIINDLVSVGASPLVIHAYWAIENNSWLSDKKRLADLILGWKSACDKSRVTWGGGETATLQGVMKKGAIELGGSAVGIIKSKKRLIIDSLLTIGDQILLLKSNGANANGLSLIRAVAKRLRQRYQTKLSDGVTYGEAVLTKTNIYAQLIEDLLDEGVNIHYISNITGHGFRKVMRARKKFTYIIERIFDPQEVFRFIQKEAGISDYDAYGTFNMGMDYALFLPMKDVKRAQIIIKQNGFESVHAGFIEKGERQVVISPKNIIFKGDTLTLR